MKWFFTLFFILLFDNYSNAQENKFGNLWGEYVTDEHLQISLNICECNKWFFTTCVMPYGGVHENETNCDNILEVEGSYILMDSILYLKDKNGILFFSLKVLDTLNLQIFYSKNVLKKGEYLNRTLSFFPGHTCASYLSNFELIKWIIFDDKNEIWKFNTTGGIFRSKDYKIEALPDGYWRRKSEE